MRVRRRIGFASAAIFALALAGFAGCSDSSAPKVSAEVGEYQLATVNAGRLPAVVFSSAAGRITITGATMILREDKSYRETRNYTTVYTTGQVVTSSVGEDGKYSLIGTQITFSIPENAEAAGLSFVGALENGVLEYTYDGIAYRYQKP
jgi:hypothetical protein